MNIQIHTYYHFFKIWKPKIKTTKNRRRFSKIHRFQNLQFLHEISKTTLLSTSKTNVWPYQIIIKFKKIFSFIHQLSSSSILILWTQIVTNNFHYPEIPFHTLWNDHLNSTSSNLFFAPLTSLFAHASLRILDCKIKYANGQTDMLIYSPPTPAIIPTLWFHYFSIKSWTFNPFLYCRRESSVKGFKLTFLSLDFYRNSLNDIILIYELVGVKLLTKFFYRVSLCKQIFKSRTWLSRFSLRLMQKFNFIACTLETKMLSMSSENVEGAWDRILHDWLKVTKYHSRTFRFTFNPHALNAQITSVCWAAEMRENPARTRIIKVKMMIHSEENKRKFFKFPFIMLRSGERSKINRAADYWTDNAKIGKYSVEKSTQQLLCVRWDGAAGILDDWIEWYLILKWPYFRSKIIR